jgi:hypothetical protein
MPHPDAIAGKRDFACQLCHCVVELFRRSGSSHASLAIHCFECRDQGAATLDQLFCGRNRPAIETADAFDPEQAKEAPGDAALAACQCRPAIAHSVHPGVANNPKGGSGPGGPGGPGSANAAAASAATASSLLP